MSPGCDVGGVEVREWRPGWWHVRWVGHVSGMIKLSAPARFLRFTPRLLSGFCWARLGSRARTGDWLGAVGAGVVGRGRLVAAAGAWLPWGGGRMGVM